MFPFSVYNEVAPECPIMMMLFGSSSNDLLFVGNDDDRKVFYRQSMKSHFTVIYRDTPGQSWVLSVNETFIIFLEDEKYSFIEVFEGIFNESSTMRYLSPISDWKHFD